MRPAGNGLRITGWPARFVCGVRSASVLPLYHATEQEEEEDEDEEVEVEHGQTHTYTQP